MPIPARKCACVVKPASSKHAASREASARRVKSTHAVMSCNPTCTNGSSCACDGGNGTIRVPSCRSGKIVLRARQTVVEPKRRAWRSAVRDRLRPRSNARAVLGYVSVVPAAGGGAQAAAHRRHRRIRRPRSPRERPIRRSRPPVSSTASCIPAKARHRQCIQHLVGEMTPSKGSSGRGAIEPLDRARQDAAGALQDAGAAAREDRH